MSLVLLVNSEFIASTNPLISSSYLLVRLRVILIEANLSWIDSRNPIASHFLNFEMAFDIST